MYESGILQGNTVIMVACQNGNKRIVKCALRLGCNANAQNVFFFYIIIFIDNLFIVNIWICVYDLLIMQYKGCTGLHYCFGYQYIPLGEYLISKGAKDTIVNNSGQTCYEGLNRANAWNYIKIYHDSLFGAFPRCYETIKRCCIICVYPWAYRVF